MKKLFVLSVFVLLLFALAGCAPVADKNSGQAAESKSAAAANASQATADKLEVYYFHRTARCYSCNTAGEYVSKTILEFFSDQMKSGQIDYREINVDLPENKAVARKFQASGSSLFINRIKDGQETIEQDTNIWRFLSDEAGFKSYLADKIKSYLGI